MNPVEQQDSATLLLTSRKSLLQMPKRIITASKHEKQNQTQKAILYGSLVKVYSKGTAQNYGGYQCQI